MYCPTVAVFGQVPVDAIELVMLLKLVPMLTLPASKESSKSKEVKMLSNWLFWFWICRWKSSSVKFWVSCAEVAALANWALLKLLVLENWDLWFWRDWFKAFELAAFCDWSDAWAEERNWEEARVE